jgi:DNA-directed RNA polymerase subunit RPC12/RpoP
MSEETNKNCSVCGKPIINTGLNLAHTDGGVVEMKCQNCGWIGGQYGGVTQCVRCGDMTSLVRDHVAS